MIAALFSTPLRRFLLSVLLCAGLGLALFSELYAAPRADQRPTPAASPEAASLPKISNRFTLPPLDSLAEVVERPLFSASRRPLAAQTSNHVDQPLNASLAGIVISNSSSSIVVSHGDPPVLTRLRQGDDLDGWSIGSIEANGVVLRRGGAERQLKLHDAPGQAAGETAAKPEPAPKSRR